MSLHVKTPFPRSLLNDLARFTGKMSDTRKVMRQDSGTEKPKKGDEDTLNYTGDLPNDNTGSETDNRRMQYISARSRIGRNLRPKASDIDAISHLSWDSSSQELAAVLRSLQTRTPAYIHPRPITFQTKAKKKHLAPHLETPEERQLLNNDTFTEFWSRTGTPHARGLNGIALFLTQCQSRTARQDWKEDWWHCWAVALLKKSEGYGKVLMIYDCDTDDSCDFDVLQPGRLLLQAQCQLIKIAREQGKLDSVWVGNAGLKPERKWCCIFNTAQWIQQSTSELDIPFQGPDDERLRGFHQIKRR